jgi:hypothetical protein
LDEARRQMSSWHRRAPTRSTGQVAPRSLTALSQILFGEELRVTDRWTFDVRRDPNPHLGYGGGGVHFCLGANLARREITMVSDELHRQIPDIAATEEPAGLLSAFVHGIKRLPVAWTPPR